MSFNKITIYGNLGRDPELRYTPAGKAVCSASIATTEKRKGQEDITTWFKVTFWGQLAETVAKYLTKGSPIFVEGPMRLENYTDRDGNERTSIEVTATDLKLVGGGRERQDESGDDEEAEEAPAPAPKAAKTTGKKAAGKPVAAPADPDDDIPF